MGSMSGLVLLLPHGYEGQGPEHSSARLERFLQSCAENNIQVCYPTLPSQYFHLIRRQIHRKFRKPLVLMMPKSLLRDERSSSKLDEFTEGRLHLVIDDDSVKPEKVERVLFCTGKVYFGLLAGREERKLSNAAIVRVEQLYPFPKIELEGVITRYPKAKEFFWVQEEPQNMGAWTFIEPRLRGLVPGRLEYRGRGEAASPRSWLLPCAPIGRTGIHQERVGKRTHSRCEVDRFRSHRSKRHFEGATWQQLKSTSPP